MLLERVENSLPPEQLLSPPAWFSFLGLKRSECKAHHLLTFNLQVEKECSYISVSNIHPKAKFR
jgi:hypothetical protein